MEPTGAVRHRQCEALGAAREAGRLESLNTIAQAGRDWVDNQKDCPEGEL
jgi:hypothetical protein